MRKVVRPHVYLMHSGSVHARTRSFISPAKPCFGLILLAPALRAADTLEARPPHAVVPTSEQALPVDTVAVKRDRVQSVRAHVRGCGVQAPVYTGLAEDLFDGCLVQRIKAELGNERNHIWCVGVRDFFRLEMVDGHGGYTFGFLLNVEDFRRCLVSIDDDVEEAEKQSESRSKSRRHCSPCTSGEFYGSTELLVCHFKEAVERTVSTGESMPLCYPIYGSQA